jgi:CDP-diacylglycerol--glycerol-3-phosphate 3-phosphatidyltransferase
MVMVLITVGSGPLWVSLLVYATVVVTVLSGADYFFGLRRQLTEARRATPGGSYDRPPAHPS